MAASVPLRRTWQRAAVLLSRGRLAKIAGWRTKRASLQLTCPTAVSGGYKRYIYTFSQVKSSQVKSSSSSFTEATYMLRSVQYSTVQ